MTAEQIIATINQLPITQNSHTQNALDTITKTAAAIAPIMAEKGLQITKGSSSPSTSRSYARIYLERGDNSHNKNNGDYAEMVVEEWEWQTQSKKHWTAISPRAIVKFSKELADAVNAA